MDNNCKICGCSARRITGRDKAVNKCTGCGMQVIEYDTKVVHLFELDGNKYTHTEFYNGHSYYRKNGMELGKKEYIHLYMLFQVKAKNRKK